MCAFASVGSSASVFRIVHSDAASEARSGGLLLRSSSVETPAFMPVGTLGAVKGVSFDLLEQWDCRLVLANTYHLMLRPGVDVVRRAGGLHAFMGWKRAVLTDSGGFQVMSLAARRRVEEEGVEFRSHLDGTRYWLTPELAMELQSAFGVDVAMALDVCPALPAPRTEIAEAVRRTGVWAARCRRSYAGEGALFGIAQGGAYEDLRRESVEVLRDLAFDGYAVGGVAVGESKSEIREATEMTVNLLPREAPRYLMGIGTPGDILSAVRAGIDLFDCVLPTRNGRMGHAYTSAGEVTIKHERFREDFSPLDPLCGCPVCRRHTRAYLRNLFLLKDITAPVLLSVHNVFFYLRWMRTIREALGEGRLEQLAAPPEAKIE
jgi:queuine tRNA-ribosyltransferase